MMMHTLTSKGRISLTPLLTTRPEPIRPPINWPIAIVNPIPQATCPPIVKKSKEAMFEVKLSNFVLAVAFAMPKPARETNAIAKNEPVPGPKKPS